MTRKELFELVQKIVVGRDRNGRPARHKPLLFLLALGNLLAGEDRLSPYESIEIRFNELFKKHGGLLKKLKPSENPALYPFWHLFSDKLWAIPNRAKIPVGGNKRPRKATLIQLRAKGGFPDQVYDLLRSDLALLGAVADVVLKKYFTSDQHEQICKDVEIPFGTQRLALGGQLIDWDFRREILPAYQYCCAICDFDLSARDFDIDIVNDFCGLEATHIKWHSHGGPDHISNGLALCLTHRRALDRGFLGLRKSRGSREIEVLVSRVIQENSSAFDRFVDLRNTRFRPLHNSKLEPANKYMKWHYENIFRTL